MPNDDDNPHLVGGPGESSYARRRPRTMSASTIATLRQSMGILADIAAFSRRIRADDVAARAERARWLAASYVDQLEGHQARALADTWTGPDIAPGPADAADQPVATQVATDAHHQRGSYAIGQVPLSARELEVVSLISQGLTNKEIAERLVLSPGTVANHVAHALAKLNVRSRTDAAMWVVSNQLVEPGTPRALERPA
jgi:DNA-binding NarL/FixJ family response regulator